MRISLIFILVFTSSFRVDAQDGHLSMYDAAPLYLNPALTGVMEGDYRVHGHYRTQWKAVNFKPYTSGLISFDMPIRKWGIGVQLNNFRAGQGNFNVFQGLVSAAYYVPLTKNKNHVINFGVQGGLTQKSLEYQLLSFNNQYTLNNGGEFDKTLVSNEQFGQQSDILPMLNASALYYYSKSQARFNPFIGVSVFNLLKPKESFYSVDNRLPMRYFIHLGSRINITELIYVVPKVLIMHQNKFNEQTYSAELGYFLKSSEMYLLAGVIFRSRDAFITTLGVKMDQFIVKVAYDFNVSKLTNSSSGRGGFELSLTYTHKKNKPIDYKVCPRL